MKKKLKSKKNTKKISNKDNKFFESQYQILFDFKKKYGLYELGLMSNFTWHNDPKRLLFMLSRYKFVAKMLNGQKNCFEMGCGDAFGTRIVRQVVKNVCAYDIDNIFIKLNKKENLNNPNFNISFINHDILKKPLPKKFSSGYSLDVLEHINPKYTSKYFSNIKKSLLDDGIFIVGMPSLESQKFASKESLEGHVNCMKAQDLLKHCLKHFKNAFIFSMNDEVLHTGFFPMSNYIFCLCVGVKK